MIFSTSDNDDGNICFLVGFNARLVFYIIPVACIWLMSIIVLVYSIIQTTRKKKGNDAALGKSNRANVNIPSIATRLLYLEYLKYLASKHK